MGTVLQDKVAIVTGAGRGIGRGIALEFSREGAKVVVASRTQSTVDRTVQEIKDEGGTAFGIQCDVSDKAAIARAVAETVAQFGGIDILVNNAQSFGTAANVTAAPLPIPLESFDDDEWDHTILTGLTSSYWFMKAAFPYLAKSGHGRIINFASGSGLRATEGAVAYNCTKEAIRGLSRTAAREWGQHGITVNVITPAIVSDAFEAYIQDHQEQQANILTDTPMRRFGDIYKDGGRVAVFIAGPDASFLTGMNFLVDGGLFMHA